VSHTLRRILLLATLACVLLQAYVVLDAFAAPSCGVCPRAREACRTAANREHTACRAECRASGGGATCLAGCTTARDAERVACEADRAACDAECDPGATPACAASCGASLGACRSLARDDARGCRRACAGMAGRDARQACLRACRHAQASGWRSCARQVVACASGCVPDAGCVASGLTGDGLAACSAYCGRFACVQSGQGYCGAARELLQRVSDADAFPCDCARNPDAGLPPPPAPEPIALATVPVPDHVTSMRQPWWAKDGSRIIAAAVSPLYVRPAELVTVAEDGSDFRCLTCAGSLPGDPALRKPFPFPDGRRIMARVGTQNPLVAAEHAVVECTPSIADCTTAVVVPIEVPGAGDPGVTQPAREFRVAPDDVHVAFTQIRRRPEGGEVPLMVVGALTRLADRYVVEGSRVVGTDGELKEFTRDGQAILFLSSARDQSFNFDDYRRDLATGATTRVMRHPDYDEAIDESPDGEWYVIGSGRTLGLWERFSQVPRPGVVDLSLAQRLLSWFLLHGEGGIGEPWLIDRHAERAGYIGQRVNAGAELEGANGRAIANWHPDGTRIVFWETIDPAFLAPGDPESRIRVATLTARAPVAEPVVAQPLPDMPWAPPLAGFALPPAPDPAGTFAGRVGGTMRVTLDDATPRRLAITYDRYTDDGRSVLEGTESVLFDPANLLAAAEWNADVVLSGCHTGFHRAQDVRIAPFVLTGTFASECDGRLIEGLP